MEIREFNHTIVALRGELKAYAQKLTGNDCRAEDLVQEVMLRMWEMRSKLDGYADKKALALTILKNKCRDEWRHDSLTHGKKQVDEPTASAYNGIEAMDEARLIGVIVDHLPPLQRQVFRMKEIGGYDSSEIIEITGCTPESLRQNLSRARRKIREDFIRLTAMRIPGAEGNE